LGFALRSRIKYSRLESLHRNENKENPSREGEAAGATRKREKGKKAKDRIPATGPTLGQGEKCH
jgi:hypothetical protein